MTSIALVETIFLFVSVNSVSSSSDFEATTAALPMPLRRSDILEVLWPRHRSWMRAHVVTERLKLLCRRQILIVKCSPSLQQLRTIMAGLSRCHRVWATYWRWFGSLADLGCWFRFQSGAKNGTMATFCNVAFFRVYAQCNATLPMKMIEGFPFFCFIVHIQFHVVTRQSFKTCLSSTQSSKELNEKTPLSRKDKTELR